MIWGAIAGDIIGSAFEHKVKGRLVKNFTDKSIPLFSDDSRYTDDTVLTIAVCEIILNGSNPYLTFHRYFNHDSDIGYGKTFFQWAYHQKTEPYGSYGNGSAMRSSPCAYISDDLKECLQKAQDIASITHNHPEGIKGALAVTHAIWLARKGFSKNEIKETIENEYKYNLSKTLKQIRPDYKFDSSCQGSVPQSIISFLEANDFEEAIRNAISLDGDTDTMACISGAIAEAYYGGVTENIKDFCYDLLEQDEPHKGYLEVIESFCDYYQ